MFVVLQLVLYLCYKTSLFKEVFTSRRNNSLLSFIIGFDMILLGELLRKLSFYIVPQKMDVYQDRVRSHFDEFHSSFESTKPGQR